LKPSSLTATALTLPFLFSPELHLPQAQHRKLPSGSSNNMQLQDNHTTENNKWDFQP
jgi:hypothetical protein